MKKYRLVSNKPQTPNRSFSLQDGAYAFFYTVKDGDWHNKGYIPFEEYEDWE